MPLLPGTKNIRNNVKELNEGKIGPARMKAIKTYAKRKGITFKEARFKLSLVIAKSKSRE